MIRMSRRNSRMHMTSRWVLMAVFVVFSLLLSSCSSGGGDGGTSLNPTKKLGRDEEAPGEFDDDSTMAAIQKRGKLLVGLPLDEPQFSYRNPLTGAIEGFDVEIAKQIATGIFGTQLENRLQFIELDPRDRELQLEGRKVDIAMGRYEISVNRKKFVDFAGPYYIAHQAALVSQRRTTNQAEIASLLDLAGKKVCVVQGSTDLDALQREAPGADASTVRSTVQECGVLLKANAVVAIAADYVDLQPVLVDRNVALLKQYAPLPYGVGVHKGTDDLRQFINDRLDNQVAEVWSDLYQRTVGNTGAREEQPPTDRY